MRRSSQYGLTIQRGFSIPPIEIEWLKKIGFGSASEGIRILVERNEAFKEFAAEKEEEAKAS